MKLRTAYEDYHKGSHQHKPRTVEEYRTSINHWERLTEDPDMQEVDNARMLKFRMDFESQPLPSSGCLPAAATSRKTLVQIQSIFATVGPAQLGNPHGLNLLSRIPCCRKPEAQPAEIVTCSADEIAAMYEQAQCANWPHWGGDPAAWWRCLIVYLWCIGSRRNEFLSLRREDVHLEKQLLRIVPLKGGDHSWKSIPEQLLFEMEQMQDVPRELWFACPQNRKSLYGTWHRIQAKAGIFVKRAPHDRRKPFYGFHELRKTAGTNWCAINPVMAQSMLGHRKMDTTVRHYTDKTRLQRQFAEELPNPFRRELPGEERHILKFPGLGG